MTDTPISLNQEAFEKWFAERYGAMLPLARYTEEGDYASPKARGTWAAWEAGYNAKSREF